MPTLPQAGVRFVAPGAAAFNAAAAGASKAVTGFGFAAKAAIGVANKAFGLLGQIGIGALREIGAFLIRGLVAAGREALRFASDLVQASLKGSELEKTSQSLYAGLVQVTKVSFSPLASQIDNLVKTAGPGFLGIVQAAETYLGGLAGKALAWGQGLITSFAQGIIDGAVAVINALASIANAIAFWLSPGSPPRLLPDIDKWGAGAMDAYLGGFMLADFGVFKEIASTVEANLRSLSTGKDTGLIPSIIGSREAIAAAVAAVRSAGQVTQATLDQVYSALGPTTQAMRDYVAATLNLEVANGAVAAAQAEVNRLTREYDALLAPVDAQLAAITEEQKQIAENGTLAQLALVGQDPNATASDKRLAALEIERIMAERNRRALLVQADAAIDAATVVLTAAQEQAVAAQAAFDLAKAQVSLETENNNLLREQSNLLDGLLTTIGALAAKLAGGGLSIPKAMMPDMSWLDELIAKFGEPLETLRVAWETLWVKIALAMVPAVLAWNNLVVPAWDRLVKTFKDTLPEIETAIGKMVAYALQAMAITLPIVFRIASVALDLMTTIWKEDHDEILSATTWAFEAIVKIVVAAMIITMTTIVGTLAIIRDYFRLWDMAVEASGTLFDNIMRGISAAVDAPKNAINALKSAAQSLYDWLSSHVFNFIINLPSLPSWAIPGSPTPFEMGLRGIARAMREVNAISVGTMAPRVSPPASAARIGAMGGGGNTSNSTRNLYYQPNYSTPGRGAAQDYSVMASIFGGAG